MRRRCITILMTLAFGLAAVCVIAIGAWGILPGAMSQTLSDSPQGKVSADELSAAIKTQKQADSKLVRGESAERRFQEIGAQLQLTGGTAPVIVQLRVAWRPEGEIQTEAERLAQRAAIRQTQDDLLNSVFGGVPDSLKRFDYVPYLAVSVNSAELDALHSSTLVIDVFDDNGVPVAQAQSPSIDLIGANNAWQMGYTGADKIIAILDTGMDNTHPALSGKVVQEACYSTDNSNLHISSLCPGGVKESTVPGAGVNCAMSLSPDCAHGTSVAGIALGVARDANLISIQVNSLVNDEGQCGVGAAPCVIALPSDQMKGLERVYTLSLSETYKNKIAAANISAGLGRNTATCDSKPIKTTIDQLRSVGIATVVASGNGQYADALGSPACVSTAVSVGATGDGASLPAGNVMSISNSAEFLKLLAPGYYNSAPIPGGGFNNVSGTSVAAAHVSGAWALLKQQQPAASVSAVLSRLVNNGVNVTDPRNTITRQRIKVDSALSCLQNVLEDRWKGEYFDNNDLKGDPVMIRDDGGSFLNMNFVDGSPGSNCGPIPTLGADNFSVRWTRMVNLPTNLYRFSVTADDGVRLYIGGKLKLDFWNGPPGTNQVDVFLDANAGAHEIKLEFREFGGNALASLSWTTPCIAAGVPAGNWKGEYFNNLDLAGSPLMVLDDGNVSIDKDWGGGSPSSACGIGVDNFSVRWTRIINFPTNYTRFTYTGDDGIRLYIDGQLKLDLWNVTAGAGAIDVEIPAGNHEVKFEYREFGGLAVARLSFKAYVPVNFYPGVNQTPDPGQGVAEAVSSPSNTGHGATSSFVALGGKSGRSQTKTSLWHSFPGVSEPRRRVILKFDWTLNASVSVDGLDDFVSATAEYDFRIAYSLDNGSTWTVRVGASDSVSIDGLNSDGDFINTSGSESIELPNNIDITQIRIRDRIYAHAAVRGSLDGSASSNATATVSNIRIEVECACSFISQWTSRDSKHDTLISHDIRYPQRRIQINSDEPTSSSSLLSRSDRTNYQRYGSVNRSRRSLLTPRWHFTARACHSYETGSG